MNRTVKDLIFLLSCSVNGVVPDKDRLREMDMDKLYKFSGLHSLRACTYTALKSAGAENNSFSQAYNKAVRKNVLLDIERTAILSEFEKNEIWYLPMKGILLKELYPENGMREMADNDILYDRTKQRKVRDIMLSHGYAIEEYGKGHHDVYMKPPVMNFELHIDFFNNNQPDSYRKIYSEPKKLMIKDEGRKYGYHLSDEDFYVYITAHECQHFRRGGTGLRSLLDCYVYLSKKGYKLDREHISQQLDILGIKEYEEKRRLLAMKLFSSPDMPELSTDESELLSQYTMFGTYGSVDRLEYNQMNKFFTENNTTSKFRFLLSCIFPPVDHMRKWFPFFYEHKLLLPLGYVWRWIHAIFKRSHIIKAILKTTFRRDKDK